MKRVHNLGRALTIITEVDVARELEHEFGSAMGAPMGEIYASRNYRRGEAKSGRLLRKRVKAITGAKMADVLREAERRTSDKVMYRARIRLYAEILHRITGGR